MPNALLCSAIPPPGVVLVSMYLKLSERCAVTSHPILPECQKWPCLFSISTLQARHECSLPSAVDNEGKSNLGAENENEIWLAYRLEHEQLVESGTLTDVPKPFRAVYGENT